MIKKKLGAIVLSIAMFMSILPTSVMHAAYDYGNAEILQNVTSGNEDTLPHLVLETLACEDFTSTNGSALKFTPTTITNLQANDVFYVGIKAVNFDKFKPLTEYGLASWNWGIVYDSNYIKWEPDQNALNKPPKQLNTRMEKWAYYYYDQNNETLPYMYQGGGYAFDGYTEKAASSDSEEGNDKSEGMQVINLICMPTATNNLTKSIDPNEYLAIVKFKCTGVPSPKKRVVGFSKSFSDNNFVFGAGATSYPLSWNGTTHLENYLVLDDSSTDYFPADTETLSSIAVAGAPTLSYVAGNNFDPTVSSGTSLSVTPTTTEGEQAAISPTKTDYKGLKFYVAATNDLGDNMATATEITKDTALTVNDHNNKYVYVAYTVGGVTKAVCLGQLSVSAKAITGIAFDDANSTFNDAGNTYYTSQNILDVLTGNGAKTLTADITYNNGDTDGADVAYAAFAGKGIALYQVKDNKLATIGTTDKFAESNTFYIAETGKAGQDPTAVTIKSAAITVSATTDTIVIKSIADAKLAYATAEDTAGDKRNVIDFSTANITTYTKSVGDNDETNTTQTVSALGTDKLIFYYGDTSTAAYDAGKVITSGTTPYTSDLKTKYVFVVPADDTAATPVLVGQLKDRAISTSTGDVGTGYTVTGITTNANTQYGDKLGNGAKIAVKYDNGDTKELSYNDFATEGITMKIVDKDGNVLVGDTDTVSSNTVLTPAMSGGFVQFFYNGTKIGGTSTALTVKKKTVGYSSKANFSVATPYIEKEYDGTTKLAEGDEAKVAFKIDEDDLIDDDLKGGKLDITGVTYSYNSKNVADADAIVASETTPATGTTAGSFGVSGSTDAVNKFKANYELAPLTDANKTVYEHDNVKITAKELTVDGSKLTIPSIEVQSEKADVEKTITNPLQLTTVNSNIISITDGTTKKTDDVKLTYKYKYAANDVQTPSEKNTDGTYKADKDVEITGTGANGVYVITGDDSGNYDVTNLSITGAKGTVENKKLNTITINTAPTKATYTYPDTKLDLTGIKFNLNYEGATTPTVIDLTQFLTDGGIITVTDAADQSQTITADNAAGVISLPYGETTLNIAYGGKTTTTKVTTNKKPIKLSEITFAASKVYGQDDAAATKTATPPTGAIEAADADAVQFTFDAKFADESAGENKNVTISNVKLVKKGEGTTDPSVNYVIVKDNGDPIAETDTTTIDTGVISQGAQAAPAKPTVKVDSATNNIIVEGPLGENIEYSIDGGQTWQSDVTFTGLTKGTNYTVQARVKATADGNYAPSEPTASEPVTTFKYHVAIYKKNAKEGSEPAYEVYTDTSSAASKADLNALLPKKISNLKEFYTDAPATIKVEYPYTLAAENVLYYTTSGGGGGGAGSSVTITLDKTSVSGEVGNSEKVTATIKGSTATPKWTSSDEKVATVDQNGNITFVGEGKATVKINVSGTVKSVAVTVTAAKATPVPTVEPTVEPTDKPSEPDTPIIDVNYTKPYASGYEDDTFRPENKITRAELAAMIARLSYGDDLPDGAYVSSFPDIEADAWFNKYVGYLEDKNVLNGYEDGTFRPYDTVTRGEISTVIARAQRYELIPYSGIFADVTDSDWAKDYIQTLASQGIISGYEDGTFGPYSPLSRAEAVTIINNVLAPSTPIVTFTPNDIAGHWAEANIILAVNERMLGGTWSEDLNPVEIPTPEATEAPAEEEAPAPEATEAPAEEVVPEGELDPTVKDEPAVPVNPEA